MIANGLQNETPLLYYNLPGLYIHHCDVISQLMACYSGLSFGDLRLSRNARWSLTSRPIRILCMSCSERIMSLLQSEYLILLSYFQPNCPPLTLHPVYHIISLMTLPCVPFTFLHLLFVPHPHPSNVSLHNPYVSAAFTIPPT